MQPYTVGWVKNKELYAVHKEMGVSQTCFLIKAPIPVFGELNILK